MKHCPVRLAPAAPEDREQASSFDGRARSRVVMNVGGSFDTQINQRQT
jgi:hypothetical protein